MICATVLNLPAVSRRTIHFVSLGCPKNRVDTEVMLGVAGLSQFDVVAEAEAADVIVVNTCAFIGPAKEESIETIFQMSEYKSTGRCEQLVVSGCLSQRYAGDLAKEMPEVDHFLGTGDMLKLGAILEKRDNLDRILVGNPADYTFASSDPRALSQNRAMAYVKIAEGCNRSCSFCAIPSFRGKQRSRSIEDIRLEVERLVGDGVKEINLISQDTISFGRDLKDDATNLEGLLKSLNDVAGLEWLRVFYLYPENMSPGLVELLSGGGKILPYIDMPLQHVTDDMLKIMRRGYGRNRQERVVTELKKSIPNGVFRTAFIVGHPGETEADFEQLMSFVEWADFDRVGVFGYSDEEGTKSATLGDQVATSVRNSRVRKLNHLARKIIRRKQKQMIGQSLKVLVEQPSTEHEYLWDGRWWGQAPEIDGKVVLTQNEDTTPVEPAVGDFVNVIVTHAADVDLIAEIQDVAPNGSHQVGQSHQSPPRAKSKRLPVARN